jgi:hypothetical protein
MKTPTHSSIRVSLEMGMIAFFILAALSLMVVYLADPSIYAQSLSLASSPADRYPVPVKPYLSSYKSGSLRQKDEPNCANE